MEQDIGFEPMTFSLATKHSTTELILHCLAESIGVEPIHPLLNDRLAICCLAARPTFLNSATYSLNHFQSCCTRLERRVSQILYGRILAEGRRVELHPRLSRTWFSRPVAGPSPLHYLPLFGALEWNRTTN
jgi:hypothetical protein